MTPRELLIICRTARVGDVLGATARGRLVWPVRDQGDHDERVWLPVTPGRQVTRLHNVDMLRIFFVDNKAEQNVVKQDATSVHQPREHYVSWTSKYNSDVTARVSQTVCDDPGADTDDKAYVGTNGTWAKHSGAAGRQTFYQKYEEQKEPSYRMEPTKKFNADEAFNALKSVVDKRMEGFRYHPKFCSNMTKMLSDEIKDEVKKLKFDRYKIVAVVHISEKRGQSMMVASRCAWDKNVDEFATYTMETPTLFCSASVFGIYNE
ncbi:TC1DB-like protein [Mya arenaria]|uniref:TC1DB-like protein n=1 Tax=Mya arenaria TaxID=6604 RepID=A0ABY7FNL4_MYAAR|nr:TC1DB-like protein [Mya arenaria]